MPYKDPHSPEAIASAKRRTQKYDQTHRELRRQWNQERYWNNPEKERERNRWYKNLLSVEQRCVNCGKPRDRGKKTFCSVCAPIHAERTRKVHEKLRMDAFNAYGGPQCVCCGTLIDEFLTIDHIHGGGNKQKKEIGGGGVKLYLWLKRNDYPPGFQVLCMNCNFAKGKYGRCPHQRALEVVA